MRLHSIFPFIKPTQQLTSVSRIHRRMKRNFQLFSSTANWENMQKEPQNPLVIIIAGPTAVGKSAVAAKICSKECATEIVRQHAINNNHSSELQQDVRARGNIISADSVQVYEGVQIGANKPTTEERAETTHHLIDIVDSRSVCQYNAADWMRDAMQVLDRLKNVHDMSDSEDEGAQDEETTQRKARIEKFLAENREDDKVDVLPVIVGGTMMYLQWLVHGRPDAMKPSQEAVEKAAGAVEYYASQGDGSGWDAAIDHVSSLGPIFADRVSKLPGKDWYRLRRTLEVAYTVLEDEDMKEKIKELYNGQRQGGLDASLIYDVRCFFLCPDDRMTHTAVVDSRCEQMLSDGLLKETTDLHLSGQLPEQGQQAKAIGYRQTLDYLKRENFKPNDPEAFGAYLNEFTTSTRRYAKKQMQWFRKDNKFMFVPVPIAEDSSSRVEKVTKIIQEMCVMPRKDFEMELIPADISKKKEITKEIAYEAKGVKDDTVDALPLSARTKLQNEKQGKQMKFYQSKRHSLIEGSQNYQFVMKEADECTSRIHLLCAVKNN